MDLTFVLDVSGGVSESEYNQVIEIATEITEELRDDIVARPDDRGIQIASVSSGRSADVEYYLGRFGNAQETTDEWDRILDHRGGDNVLYDALQAVVSVYDRGQTGNPNLVIIISNGDRVPDTDEVLNQKQRMEDSSDRFYFYTVYLNRDDNYRFIRSLSTSGIYNTYDDIVVDRSFDNFYRAADEACRGEIQTS